MARNEKMANLIKELVKQKMVVAIAGGSFKQMLTQFLPPFSHDETMMPFIHNFTFLPTSGSQRYQYDERKKEWILVDKEPFPDGVKEKIIKFNLRFISIHLVLDCVCLNAPVFWTQNLMFIIENQQQKASEDQHLRFSLAMVNKG